MSKVSPEEHSKLEGSSFSAKTNLSLEEAMSLYGLTDSQSFWEIEQDTRCLIGWGNNTVVVSFRGTASMKNALADLQVRNCHWPCFRFLAVACGHVNKLFHT